MNEQMAIEGLWHIYNNYDNCMGEAVQSSFIQGKVSSLRKIKFVLSYRRDKKSLKIGYWTNPQEPEAFIGAS